MPNAPKPFSSEWLNAPADAPVRHARQQGAFRQQLIRVFAGFPGDRPLALMLVSALVVISFLLQGPTLPKGISQTSGLVGHVTDKPDIAFQDPEPTEEADISTDQLQVTDGTTETPTPTPTQAPVNPDSDLQSGSETRLPNTPDGILPNNRILAYYGFPGDEEMGILGEYGMDQLLEQLQNQAAEYEAADPDHPVVIAFELVASVAQSEPQADGSYLAEAPSDVLDEYANFTRDNGLLMILDVQVGRRGVSDDVQGLQQWLKLPHVHLAIDPEFSFTKPGEGPGMDIVGSITADDVTWTQQYLVNLATESNLPPKVLIVHQFLEKMISNKTQIQPVKGVQLVIDIDGHGAKDVKESIYQLFTTGDQLIEYTGIKIFYSDDIPPLMTPDEVVNLDPPPLYVMYQ